ncbi:MAG: CoA pyrophosphatase [Desulfobacteraceae bacterium]|nr:CoA pyrophosphatase [Desulfobacteraceae bacterium]
MTGHKPGHISPGGLKPASVLIPYYPAPGGLCLVFIKRPDYPGVHGDQISFPGGGREEGDRDDLETALRETEEEIGVNQGDIEVWGSLSTQQTLTSNFSITPFVGEIPYPYDFKPDAREVERLIIIPFSHLLAPEAYSFGLYNWKGMNFESDLYQYGKDIIWGLTARILNSLITLIKTGMETKGAL